MIRVPLGFTFAMVGGFVTTYLRLGSWAPLLEKALVINSALVVMMVVFPVFRYVPALAFAVIFVVPLLCIWATMSAFRLQRKGTNFLLAGFVVFAISTCATFLASLGILPGSPVALTNFDVGMLVMAVMMSAGLASRFSEDRLAAEVAERAMATKNIFLANMSHEIRTPMNGVMGMLTLIKNGELSQRQMQYVGMAESSAKSLLGLINDILDFSKIEAGKLELENVDFNVVTVLEETVESLAHQGQEKGLEIVLDTVNVTHPFVNGDPGRTRQVLTNLVGNANKFTKIGEIIIEARMEPVLGGQNLYCSITDSGVGIEEGKVEKLFDRFSQVDTSTTREFGGSGLGLAIAKHLCDMMGGKLA